MIKVIKKFKKRHPDIHALIALFAVIMLWRTAWGVMDHYFLPNWPLMSYAIGGIIGFLILLLDDFHLSEL